MVSKLIRTTPKNVKNRVRSIKSASFAMNLQIQNHMHSFVTSADASQQSDGSNTLI